MRYIPTSALYIKPVISILAKSSIRMIPQNRIRIQSPMCMSMCMCKPMPMQIMIMIMSIHLNTIQKPIPLNSSRGIQLLQLIHDNGSLQDIVQLHRVGIGVGVGVVFIRSVDIDIAIVVPVFIGR